MTDRIRRAVLGSGMKQKDLAEALGVTPAAVNNWLNRGAENVRVETLFKLAAVTGTSPLWLVTGEGPETGGYEIRQVGIQVPVIQWPTLGVALRSDSPVAIQDDWRFSPVECGPRTFAVRLPQAVADAMMAVGPVSYPPGCLIFVDPDLTDPEHGRPVLAKLESTGDIVFKVFMTEAGRSWLRSLNPAYPAIHGGFRVVGTIIGKWEDS